MPPLQKSLTISLLRVALWWQKWQRTGDFNTFHVIFGAKMLFFSSFSFRLRRLLAPVKVPPLSFEGAFSLSAPWGGTISSMGWSNKRNGTSLRIKKRIILDRLQFPLLSKTYFQTDQDQCQILVSLFFLLLPYPNDAPDHEYLLLHIHNNSICRSESKNT